MNLFDILGPVMVGPSSSHTAARFGWGARRADCWARARRAKRRSRYSALLPQPATDTAQTAR